MVQLDLFIFTSVQFSQLSSYWRKNAKDGFKLNVLFAVLFDCITAA